MEGKSNTILKNKNPPLRIPIIPKNTFLAQGLDGEMGAKSLVFDQQAGGLAMGDGMMVFRKCLSLRLEVRVYVWFLIQRGVWKWEGGKGSLMREAERLCWGFGGSGGGWGVERRWSDEGAEGEGRKGQVGDREDRKSKRRKGEVENPC